MRLRQIKLAGFKSFVDPTTVALPGNRCSIVGPNGGGKSNIVDAVRWVMGESSARQLRGEQLSDVIFNGSRSRKLSGVASIELIFDNSDGRMGGEYAAYGEISIRRQVSRDSQSVYHLNGTRCRRRDVADLFLGTGFGPRSYSIIEQGMIDKLVQARPEELRVYLEEAAGISRYKERRRETENRIRHTRENLERLRDTLEEMGRTLDRLRKQARAAERYKELKAEESLRTAELYAIRYLELSARLEILDRDLRKRDADLERLRAGLRSLETELAQARVQHEQESEKSREEQQFFYSLREEIAHIEQTLKLNRARIADFERELAELRVKAAETGRQLDMDREDIDGLAAAIGELTPAVEAAERADAEASARLGEIERAYAAWQEEWDRYSRESAEAARSAQIQASRIEHSEGFIAGLEARIERLAREEQAPAGVETTRVDSLAAEIATHQQRRSTLEDDVERCLKELAAGREAILIREADLDEARQDLQALRHEFATRQAAQQAALGRTDEDVRNWIAEQGLDEAPRVGETLSVVPGWERAVELVLGEFLQGLRVDDAAYHAAALSALGGGQVALVEARIEASVQGDLPGLGSLIRSSDMKLGSLLHGVFAAETDEVALESRSTLDAGQSIVTRSGLWVGPDWMRKFPESDAEAGIIQRAQELETLEVRVEEAERTVADLQGGLDAARDVVRGLEEDRERLQAQADETSEALFELKADHGVQRVRLESADAQRERLQRDRGELERQLELERGSLADARQELEAAEQAAEKLAPQEETLSRSKARLLEELDGARQAARSRHDDFHSLNAERQSHASRLEAIETARKRLVEQADELERRRVTLEGNIEQAASPLPGLQSDLDTKLAEQHEAENRQREVRTRLGDLAENIRRLQAARDEAAGAVDAARSDRETARIERQGLNVERNNDRQRVEATGHDLAAVLDGVPDDAAAGDWERKLESLDRRIRRLEPVNLAAIEEFGVESERKAWLDAQHDDLEKALDTLQGAIRKIDTETRARFRDTFEIVNANLARVFPKLFAGGHAELTMTGEDLLDTGVSVMARPPGKRNASVHQLSGGEKALTAVALIFAIFQLNPSPVCILDEIDAPLDDNNVARVADLIREMSRGVQFVVITHNKLTMEMADHLIGVTMSEPGVSRLVSVDIEEAAAMAAS